MSVFQPRLRCFVMAAGAEGCVPQGRPRDSAEQAAGMQGGSKC